MKADGIEYDERMELLEEVSWPKPLAGAARAHLRGLPAQPPVGRRGRAVAEVGGARHVRAGDDLRGVRRVLRPDPVRGAGAALPRRRLPRAAADRARTACAPTSSSDIMEWLGAVVRQTDSSLLDEWEQLSDPTRAVAPPTSRRPSRRTSPPTSARSRCWSATRCSAGSSWPRCARSRRARAGRLDDRPPRTGATRSRRTSPSTTRSTPAPTRAARGCCCVEKAAARWQVQQILGDPEGDHDWRITAERRPRRLRRRGRAGPGRHRPGAALSG